MPITDKSQFLKAISIIDKLSPINFFDKCCGKFSMCLTKFFFCKSNCRNVLSRFFKKREQFTDSAVKLNKTKRQFFKITSLNGHRVFFHSANSLTYRDNLSAITNYIRKAISVIDKSNLF